MAHPEQYLFFNKVKCLHSDYFRFKTVADIGSLDVNGNLRWLFEYCNYTGIDIFAGNNVDIVMPGHRYKPQAPLDAIISAECFEHDPYFKDTLQNMYSILRAGGLMAFTCATTGRSEHGPGPEIDGRMYYRNITVEDVYNTLKPQESFSSYSIETEIKSPILSDIRFWGIKNI